METDLSEEEIAAIIAADLKKAQDRVSKAGIGEEHPLSPYEQKLIQEETARRLAENTDKTPQQKTKERRGPFH